ncbi:MAG: amino acid permease [Carnobacterium sp.]|uniref:amino acid permease n=1 Tax=Carnobacterium TaxID=2747 RepID=UPI00191B9880|nr:amino acid permease [Carnobacterium maltaromaticum]CAD5903327.1 glutamate:gamma-aminobutyric acid antiporter [Carnobacterium maltaromaticum]
MNKKKNISKFGFFAMTASLFITVYEYPTFADSGKTLIFFLLLCGIFWFLPVALSSAELATIEGYQDGGIFSWVGEPLGEKFGFAAIFFQWFQITVGFVTMIYFIIGTVSDVLNVPVLNTNVGVKFILVISIFWLLTALQFKGTKITEQVAKYGFSIGIVIPVLLMLVLAIKYIASGNQISKNFTDTHFFPDKSNISALVSFVLAYMGVEASAPHIADLENPKKDYPKIMFALVIVGVVLSTIGGSVVAMVSHGNISANAGVVNALKEIISPGKESPLVIILGILVSFGVMAQVSSWIVSPTEGLQFVASKGLLPKKYEEVNKHGVPVPLLIVQGIVVTAWAAILTFGSGSSGGNVSFQTAISLTVIIYLSAYILFFIAYLVIVFKKKELKREYQIPGGSKVKIFVAGSGLLLSIAAIMTAFMIPDTMSKTEGKTYITTLIFSYIVTVVAPFLFYQFYSKNHSLKGAAHHEDDQTRMD